MPGPEKESDRIDADELFGGLKSLCADYVLSDLRLLSDSLDELRNPGLPDVPRLLNAPELDARFSFDYSVSQEKKILFGLRRRSREDRIARFDVRMRLGPTPGPGLSKTGPMALFGTWPRFIEPALGRGSFDLVLNDGTRQHVHLPVGGEFDDATTGIGTETVSFDTLPAGLLVSIISAIAQRSRGGHSSGPAEFAEGPEISLENFLEMLSEKVDDFLDGTAILFQTEEDRQQGSTRALTRDVSDTTLLRIASYRSNISRLIGQGYTDYRFRDLSSRLRFLLDKDGKLATEPFSKGNQQYDIDAKLASIGGQNGVVVSLNVPDLLAPGPLYSGILDALARSDALADLAGRSGDLLPPGLAITPQALTSSFRRARISGGAVIARIVRAKDGGDLDFLLLRTGESPGDCWLLFLFSVTVSDRDTGDPSIGEIGDLRLVAATNRNLAWLGKRQDRRELGTYLYRVLSALYNWRMRFEGATG